MPLGVVSGCVCTACLSSSRRRESRTQLQGKCRCIVTCRFVLRTAPSFSSRNRAQGALCLSAVRIQSGLACIVLALCCLFVCLRAEDERSVLRAQLTALEVRELSLSTLFSARTCMPLLWQVEGTAATAPLLCPCTRRTCMDVLLMYKNP